LEKGNPLTGKTITLEFYIDENKKLRAVYNTCDYEFTDFWKSVDHADDLCRLLVHEFKNLHPDKFRSADLASQDWKETLIKFINNHLRDKDTILDFIMKSSGEITIKLER